MKVTLKCYYYSYYYYNIIINFIAIFKFIILKTF